MMARLSSAGQVLVMGTRRHVKVPVERFPLGQGTLIPTRQQPQTKQAVFVTMLQ